MNSFFEFFFLVNVEIDLRLWYRLQMILHFEWELYGFPILNSHYKKAMGSK